MISLHRNALLVAALSLASLLVCCARDSFDPTAPRPAEWGRRIENPDVPNWFVLDDRIQRCGQPDEEGFATLRASGVRSVLNLREHHDDGDEAEDTDLVLYHARMDAGSLTEAQIEKALKILAEAEAPIVVHCWHGSDRTGAICAAYRIVFQDWETEAAIEEMIHGGYGFHATFDNLPETLRSIDWTAFKARVR